MQSPLTHAEAFIQTQILLDKHDIGLSLLLQVSNTKNRPGKDANLIHWMALENITNGINSEFCNVFLDVLQLFSIGELHLFSFYQDGTEMKC